LDVAEARRAKLQAKLRAKQQQQQEQEQAEAESTEQGNQQKPHWAVGNTTKPRKKLSKQQEKVAERRRAREAAKRAEANAELLAQKERRTAEIQRVQQLEDEQNALDLEHKRVERIYATRRAKEKKQKHELYKQKVLLAKMHYSRAVVFYAVWKPWRRYVEKRALLREEMTVFSGFKTRARLFRQWKATVKQRQTYLLNQQQYHLKRTMFKALSRYVQETKPALYVASVHHYCLQVEKHVFTRWKRYTNEAKAVYGIRLEKLTLQSKQLARTWLQKRLFRAWRTCTRVEIEKRFQEKITDVTKLEVKSWLADFRRERKGNHTTTTPSELYLLSEQAAALPASTSLLGSVIAPLRLPSELAMSATTKPRISVPLYREPAHPSSTVVAAGRETEWIDNNVDQSLELLTLDDYIGEQASEPEEEEQFVVHQATTPTTSSAVKKKKKKNKSRRVKKPLNKLKRGKKKAAVHIPTVSSQSDLHSP
jgi:hypothetical protein